MYKGKNILGIITARGGSKGLPRKNILNILGKPLIAWTIEQALSSEYLDKVIVSTDDDEIADISKQYDVEIPFMRPKELATDTASISDAILHALRFFEDKGVIYDYIALLEPTSPLRKKEDIDEGIAKLIENPEMDTLVTLGEVHLEHPIIVKKIQKGVVISYTGLPPIYQRQQADKAYFPYGVLYISKVNSFYETRTFYTEKTISLSLERWQNYEIDDRIDLIVVERVMKEYLTSISER